MPTLSRNALLKIVGDSAEAAEIGSLATARLYDTLENPEVKQVARGNWQVDGCGCPSTLAGITSAIPLEELIPEKVRSFASQFDARTRDALGGALVGTSHVIDISDAPDFQPGDIIASHLGELDYIGGITHIRGDVVTYDLFLSAAGDGCTPQNQKSRTTGPSNVTLLYRPGRA